MGKPLKTSPRAQLQARASSNLTLIPRPASVASSRITSLDGLRGVGALLVVIYHYAGLVIPNFFGPQQRLLGAIVGRGAWWGVDLFFILSGFVVTGVLLEAKNKPGYYQDFYTSRVLRLVPALWLTFAVMFLVDRSSVSCIGLSALFLTNFASHLGVNCAANNSLWSLGAEAQFYLVAPVIVASLSRRQLQAFCLFLCVLLPALRLTVGGLEHTGLTWFRTEHFALGGLLALGYREAKATLSSRHLALKFLLAATAIGLGLIATGNFTIHTRSGLALQISLGWCLTAALFIGAFQSEPLRKLLNSEVLQYLGKRSYCLYLVHIPLASGVFLLTYRVLGPPSVTPFSDYFALGLSVFVTFAAAELSGRFLEEPILRLKDRFRASSSQANGSLK